MTYFENYVSCPIPTGQNLVKIKIIEHDKSYIREAFNMASCFFTKIYNEGI